jgi:O-acetylserine/cysteine efflux transporter
MFGLIFSAIRIGMPPGLASLVVQMQVFFTVLFSVIAFGEKPRRHEIAGASSRSSASA